MRPNKPEGGDLFRARLDQIINLIVFPARVPARTKRLGRWRKRFGSKLELLLAESLRVGTRPARCRRAISGGRR
jgi:hypothetical protein